MPDSSLRVLVLAAGQSSRMGGQDKLLMEIGGQPLLAHVLSQASATPYPVVVTLPVGAKEKLAIVAAAGATAIEVPDARSGQAASLRAYANWTQGQYKAAVMILLADMPDIDAHDITKMANEARRAPSVVLRGASDGTPGHPVVMPASLVSQFAQLKGDVGAKALTKGHTTKLVPLPGLHAITDLDSPEDWVIWHKSQTSKPK